MAMLLENQRKMERLKLVPNNYTIQREENQLSEKSTFT